MANCIQAYLLLLKSICVSLGQRSSSHASNNHGVIIVVLLAVEALALHAMHNNTTTLSTLTMCSNHETVCYALYRVSEARVHRLCTAYLNSLTVKPVVPDINCCDIICADTKVTCHNNSLYITKISV
eukprot:8258-Heterococcus_DN1.PRE.2